MKRIYVVTLWFLTSCVSLCKAGQQEDIVKDMEKFTQFASLTMQWISTLEAIKPDPVVDRLYSRKEMAASQRDVTFELARKCSPFDKQVEPYCLPFACSSNPHPFMMKYIELTAFLNKKHVERLIDQYTAKNH